MDWKKTTVALAFPVTTPAGATVGALTLREPDIDALEEIEGLGLKKGERPTIKQLKGLIVALGDQPAEIVGNMHRTDLLALSEAVVPFLSSEEEPPA